MPLWLDLLRTPMAAPESKSLRRMRLTWQALCLSCAVCVGLFSTFHRAAGLIAIAFALALIVATGLYTCVYLSMKSQADSTYLDQCGEVE